MLPLHELCHDVIITSPREKLEACVNNTCSGIANESLVIFVYFWLKCHFDGRQSLRRPECDWPKGSGVRRRRRTRELQRTGWRQTVRLVSYFASSEKKKKRPLTTITVCNDLVFQLNSVWVDLNFLTDNHEFMYVQAVIRNSRRWVLYIINKKHTHKTVSYVIPYIYILQEI